MRLITTQEFAKNIGCAVSTVRVRISLSGIYPLSRIKVSVRKYAYLYDEMQLGEISKKHKPNKRTTQK